MNSQTAVTRRVPGTTSATVAQPAQQPPARNFRHVLADLENALDTAIKELAATNCDGGQVAEALTDRWSANLRFWIVDRMFAVRAREQARKEAEEKSLLNRILK